MRLLAWLVALCAGAPKHLHWWPARGNLAYYTALQPHPQNLYKLVKDQDLSEELDWETTYHSAATLPPRLSSDALPIKPAAEKVHGKADFQLSDHSPRHSYGPRVHF